MADGELVVVTGIVRALGRLLKAPLSGTPAVAYASVARIAERRIGTSYGSNRLLTQVGDRAVVAFDLERCVGRIRIDGPEVELALARLPLVPRSLERERTFLAQHASADVDLRTVIFAERCVEPGALIEVRGLAIAEPGGTSREHGFREAGLRFRIVAHHRQPVVITSVR